LTIDREIGRDDLLRAVEIEAGFGHFLVVPLELAGLRIQRDDGRCEQVVSAPGRANFRGPRRTVSRADVDHAGDRIVVDAVPRCATAAGLPPLAFPRLRGPLELGL